MKFFLLLILLAISSISFGQKTPTRIGILQSNDLSFHNDIQIGIGISHTLNKNYVSLTMKLFAPLDLEATFKRAQLDYRYYVWGRDRRYNPFITTGFEFFRDADRSSGTTTLHPTSIYYPYPSDPNNLPVTSEYYRTSTQNSLTFLSGMGAEFRLINQLYFNFSVNILIYQKRRKYSSIYSVSPDTDYSGAIYSSGISGQLTCGLSFIFSKRTGCTLYDRDY